MAFKMNKPVIHGSKEHSALLAKAESILTHGADPAIMGAVADYSESNSPDVIDWKIKMSEIDIEKPEPPIDPNKKTTTAEEDAAAARQKLINARLAKLERKKSEGPTTETTDTTDPVEEEFEHEEFAGEAGDPYSYRTTEDGGYEFKSIGKGGRTKGEWYPATGGLDIIKGLYEKFKKE